MHEVYMAQHHPPDSRLLSQSSTPKERSASDCWKPIAGIGKPNRDHGCVSGLPGAAGAGRSDGTDVHQVLPRSPRWPKVGQLPDAPAIARSHRTRPRLLHLALAGVPLRHLQDETVADLLTAVMVSTVQAGTPLTPSPPTPLPGVREARTPPSLCRGCAAVPGRSTAVGGLFVLHRRGHREGDHTGSPGQWDGGCDDEGVPPYTLRIAVVGSKSNFSAARKYHDPGPRPQLLDLT